jgi:hypothetical protein
MVFCHLQGVCTLQMAETHADSARTPGRPAEGVIHRFRAPPYAPVAGSGRLASMTVIKLSREYAEQGYDSSELRRLGRSGELERIRRGAWTDAGQADDPRSAHLRLIEATVRQSSPEATVSHMSAAALHGLPIFSNGLQRVSLTRDRAGGGATRRYVQLHGSWLPDEDVTVLNGIRITTPARTVVDLACTLTPFQAVPIGDAALRRGLSHAQLAASLQRAGRRTGIGTARRSIWMLDPRSESVGESSSRVVFRDHNVPAPEPQFEIRDGAFVARVDFAWPGFKTIGEFDGKIKYGELVREGQTPADVLFAEKQREDRLRALGWQVVRWVWTDLLRPLALVRRLHAAFERGLRG